MEESVGRRRLRRWLLRNDLKGKGKEGLDVLLKDGVNKSKGSRARRLKKESGRVLARG